MDKRALTVAAAWLAALAFAGCTGKTPQGAKAPPEPAVAKVGQPAPGWTEPSVPGGSLTLASLRGKAVYLNFFATWCPPCNEEAPAIDALQREYGPRGLQVVGVDVLENRAKAEQFRNEHKLSYPAVVDDGTLRDQYAINGLPVHVFIDRPGVVQNIAIGEISPETMRANVLGLLR